MIEPERCANCGNAYRFVLEITHPHVRDGSWLRLACSRLCASILEQHGRAEMAAHACGVPVPDDCVTLRRAA